jgi:hypothetical protein
MEMVVSQAIQFANCPACCNPRDPRLPEAQGGRIRRPLNPAGSPCLEHVGLARISQSQGLVAYARLLGLKSVAIVL